MIYDAKTAGRLSLHYILLVQHPNHSTQHLRQDPSCFILIIMILDDCDFCRAGSIENQPFDVVRWDAMACALPPSPPLPNK